MGWKHHLTGALLLMLGLTVLLLVAYLSGPSGGGDLMWHFAG